MTDKETRILAAFDDFNDGEVSTERLLQMTADRAGVHYNDVLVCLCQHRIMGSNSNADAATD